ncbi:MAG: DUF6112 family protein [Solirubrobacteraceae bacterium]
MRPPYAAARGVSPDLGAVTASHDLGSIAGALLTYGLLTAVVMLIVCALAWAFASHSGSWHHAEKAKAGLLVALGGATLTGGALVWANFLLGVGAHL